MRDGWTTTKCWWRRRRQTTTATMTTVLKAIAIHTHRQFYEWKYNIFEFNELHSRFHALYSLTALFYFIHLFVVFFLLFQLSIECQCGIEASVAAVWRGSAAVTATTASNAQYAHSNRNSLNARNRNTHWLCLCVLRILEHVWRMSLSLCSILRVHTHSNSRNKLHYIFGFQFKTKFYNWSGPQVIGPMIDRTWLNYGHLFIEKSMRKFWKSRKLILIAITDIICIWIMFLT